MKPAILAFFAAALWGLWWIPIRALEARGMGGALGGLVMTSGAFLACLVWLAIRRGDIRMANRAALGAVLVGVAVATFSSALNYGEVVRIVLLFYLAPAWSKIIEWAFMGLPWRWSSTLALVASMIGALLVLGGDVSGSVLRLGDVLALMSGIAWAAGSALIFTSGRTNAVVLTAVTSLAAALIGLAFAAVARTGPVGPELIVPAGLGVLGGVIYVLPILILTLWSAQRLTPATLSFLLTAEILTGVISAAVLLDEPFGPWKMAGAVLIITAALSEVLASLRLDRPGLS